MKYSKYSKSSNSTLTSSQLQEFLGLINTERLDEAFVYLKQRIDDPNKRGRRRKSILDEYDKNDLSCRL